MNEKNIGQNRKSKTSMLARVSLGLAIFGSCSLVVALMCRVYFTVSILLTWGAFVASGLALVLGVISGHIIYKSRGNLGGRTDSIFGTGLAAISIFFIVAVPAPHRIITNPQMVCGSHMHSLGLALSFYSTDSNGQYPTYDIWCDLLLTHDFVGEAEFVCPAMIDGRCHYAINPNATPDSAADTVLLFETQDGWNQFGGPNILATEHHQGSGCNILFADGSVRFVKKEDLDTLRWEP